MRAQVEIPAGEEIFNRYTEWDMVSRHRRHQQLHCEQGRLERSELVRHSWHFSCHCIRCSDPSDLGTDWDSLQCGQCGGVARPELGAGGGAVSGWSCVLADCSWRLGAGEVAAREAQLAQELAGARGRADRLEQLLEGGGPPRLHRNHHLLVSTRAELARTLGARLRAQATAGSGKSWGLKAVRRVVELCQQVLAVLDRLDRGLSEVRADIMAELSAPQLMLLQVTEKTRPSL